MFSRLAQLQIRIEKVKYGIVTERSQFLWVFYAYVQNCDIELRCNMRQYL